jgi:hypothetical protein
VETLGAFFLAGTKKVRKGQRATRTCTSASGPSPGKRLNPRKADLHRWRETFAEKLRGWGTDAEASRQPRADATATTTSCGGSRLERMHDC